MVSGLVFSHYCTLESGHLKEDCTQEVVITFYLLAAITACVLSLCTYNAILLIKNGKMKRVSLALFYLFSFISLICKTNITDYRCPSHVGIFHGRRLRLLFVHVQPVHGPRALHLRVHCLCLHHQRGLADPQRLEIQAGTVPVGKRGHILLDNHTVHRPILSVRVFHLWTVRGEGREKIHEPRVSFQSQLLNIDQCGF